MTDAGSRLGLYLSVPFCRAKCSFCNFSSGVGSAGEIEGYLERLFGEIEGSAARLAELGVELPRRVDSVYLGGGTPSLLEPGQMERLFKRLRVEYEMADDAEVTLEAAPGQIGDELLQAAVACGVNRVSLGVQSLVDREARAVGRSHTGASCLGEIERLRSAGIVDVGADLICGLPHQTMESFRESFLGLAASGVTHVSVYMMEIDEKSRLGREVLGGGARMHVPELPGEEAVARMYEEACAVLPELGFGQYEISNFARAGFGSRHNLKYWMREPYLGFGLDAHSMMRGPDGRAVRWQNAGELERYLAADGPEEARTVSEREAFEEEVFLGLRLAGGLERRRLAGYPEDWLRAVERAAEPLVEAGWMEALESGWRLTVAGRLLSSSVFGELLCEEAVTV